MTIVHLDGFLVYTELYFLCIKQLWKWVHYSYCKFWLRLEQNYVLFKMHAFEANLTLYFVICFYFITKYIFYTLSFGTAIDKKILIHHIHSEKKKNRLNESYMAYEKVKFSSPVPNI